MNASKTRRPRSSRAPALENGGLARPSDSGLTLIEVLAAMTIAAVTIAFIAPPLLLSAATRAQNEKAETARLLARGAIQRVQAEMARGVAQTNESAIVPPLSSSSPLCALAAPSSTVANPGFDIVDLSLLDSPDKALEADADGDGQADFFIQLARDLEQRFPSGSNQNELATFVMVARVYDIQARANLGSGALETRAATLGATSGFGQQKTRPLAVEYSPISRSDATLSRDMIANYIDAQQSASATSCP